MPAPQYALQNVVAKAPDIPPFTFTINGVRYIGRRGPNGIFTIMRSPRWIRSMPDLPATQYLTVSSIHVPGIATIGLEFHGKDIDSALRGIVAATRLDTISSMGAVQNALKPVLAWLEPNFGV